MKVYLRKALLAAAILLALQLLFFTLLAASCLLPAATINRHAVTYELAITAEGFYPVPLLETWEAKQWGEGTVDNYTDYVMIENAKTHEAPILQRILTVGYERYWHGYLVFLRGALLFTDKYIRQIDSLIFFTLLFVSLLVTVKKTNVFLAFSILLCCIMSSLVIVPLSMHFSHVYWIMFLSITILLWKFQYFSSNVTSLWIAFMTIGAVTNYIDFLTTPLITLGIPLMVFYTALLQHAQNAMPTTKLLFQRLVCPSIAWGIGYAVTWCSKWVISIAVLGFGSWETTLKSIILRLNGDETQTINRAKMLANNIEIMFSKFHVFLFVTVVLIFIVFIFLGRNSNILKRQLCPLLCFVIVPYLWYIVMANHSQVHCWFTYRTQIVAVFSILAFLGAQIDETKIFKLLNK